MCAICPPSKSETCFRLWNAPARRPRSPLYWFDRRLPKRMHELDKDTEALLEGDRAQLTAGLN
jgi:hypothetical protein